MSFDNNVKFSKNLIQRKIIENYNYCNLLLYYTWQSNKNKYCRNIRLTSQTDLTKHYTIYLSDN